jgi:hypothetical protein
METKEFLNYHHLEIDIQDNRCKLMSKKERIIENRHLIAINKQ